MTLPLRRQHDDQAPGPSDRADEQVIARLRGMDDTGGPSASDVAMARGRVWQRLVAEHPSLLTRPTAVRTRHPGPAASGIASRPGSHLRWPVPIGRQAQGGWRAAIDVAVVAVLVIGLVLGARGVGVMPSVGDPYPLATQSLVASTPTDVATPEEAMTIRDPGPGTQAAPAALGISTATPAA